ncbi:MAG: bifunctional proline dehydrogenase/L-glutamate gamma-semialdehyde dehydrogenase [Thermodesulfobacteriota bacterium]|nr:bifunctional proline dehydrogenase/L-glutamate gamma-semialdehyde dehydrogenase [Thermodesulfobacteriota bacterium]
MQTNVESDIITQATQLARSWQTLANDLLTSEEKKIQQQMTRLLSNPADKILLTKIIDQSFRPHDPERVADQIDNLLEEYGMPDFFGDFEKLFIQMFVGLGKHFPSFAVPKMIEQMRESSSRAIIPGEAKALRAHLHRRRKQNIRMNINHLGEAVLGEDEAAKRMESYLRDMEDPDIEYISIKISTLYSQISSLAFDQTVASLSERLTRIYRAALANYFTRNDGTKVHKFVNLDMEEYRDLTITFQAFITTLEQEEFHDLSAGIVLQAYLPDSYPMQQKLTDWARQRVQNGGAPIKLRIVKGANMEMEKLESVLFNWPLAPYDNKLEVDANYKRMVRYGMQPGNIKAVNLGIASHNLFELAYAATLAEKNGVANFFYFEMLEGMADHVRRALQELSGDVLLYAPVATKDEFINAIAYLIRRLDENTAKENFLRYAPGLQVDSSDWSFLEESFVASCHFMDQAGTGPKRSQDRNTEIFAAEISSLHQNSFTNEPDTDWSLAANRHWAEGIRSRWMKSTADAPTRIPVVVAGQKLFDDRQTQKSLDPNQSPDQVCVARFVLAGGEDIDAAVRTARRDPDGWRQKTAKQRHEVLARVAMELRKKRGDFLGAAAAETGKVFTETDVEVSEAVDFAEFYPFSVHQFDAIENVNAKGKGVGLVISPWNFPVAIPCGGLVAALAAGNTVIFKPSSDAVLVAWQICQCFWEGGISKNTLQFLPCSGAQVGPQLTVHPGIDFIILTGGTDTGLSILKQTPGIYLAAETGGKNATIVTDMADRDQAIKNVIYSAFGNCGQKCSATSLLILEKTVYDDPHFRQQLVDAVQSMHVGSAWDFANKLGTLIKPPVADLQRGLNDLEIGEEWALQPIMLDNNPQIWSPGIKYGVRPDSYTHMTEFFGPVLGVMRADDLDHAIDLVNQTGYGLTSGIESLDKREQKKWQDKIFAGNLYINRGTTGAVTLRQPFGGMGKSALGPGIKAGSPDYVSQFMEFEEHGYPQTGVINQETDLLWLANDWEVMLRWGAFDTHSEDISKTIFAIRSYIFQMEQKFGRKEDYFHLRGQDNFLQYLPIKNMVIRLHPDDTLFETLARIAAARVTKCDPVVSLPEDLNNEVIDFLKGRYGKALLKNVAVVIQNDKQLQMSLLDIGRIRYANPNRVPGEVILAAVRIGFYISRTPVYMEGRLELLQYFRQQSICNNYHRYGNLGERGEVE